MTQEVYARLSAHFDKHFKDPRGLEYLTGNQVVGRLNEVLGPGGWMFMVKEHGYDAEADEVWVLGRLDATIGGVVTLREQFGSQKHNRRRAPQGEQGAILDYGFDLKGAATDALKKCATLIGVGLYLSEKEGGVDQNPEPAPRRVAPARASVSQPAPAPAAPERIDHPDHPLYQDYMSLVEIAQREEVEYEALNTPVEAAKLRAEGAALKERIKAKRSLAANGVPV